MIRRCSRATSSPPRLVSPIAFTPAQLDQLALELSNLMVDAGLIYVEILGRAGEVPVATTPSSRRS